MTLWLYLYFPTLQLDAMYLHKEKPALPLSIIDENKNEIVQLNSSARTEGLQVGMGLGTASSLCSRLHVKSYDQTLEKRTLTRIAKWLYSVTADIALCPPKGLLLRVNNMLTLHQNLDCYWQTLSQHLNRLPFNYCYATGYSPHMAKILAKQQINHITDDKAWLLKQIKKQPLSSSDLATNTRMRLQKVGVTHFSHLLALPLSSLAKRFDVEVVNYVAQLKGNTQHQVHFYIPPESFEQYLELYYEVSSSNRLEKPILKLYRLLERYLTLKDKLATEIELLLQQRDAEELTLCISAIQGEYKADKWLQLTKLSLESSILSAPVIGLTVKTKRTISKYAQGTDLFYGPQGKYTSKELIAMLIAKLGQHSVKGINLEEDYRPEIANQLCSPLQKQLTTKSTDINIKQTLRPSILLPSPLPLREQVTLLPYPERIVTGWWDEYQVARDYFIARTTQGKWLWLYKDKNKRWFVHGVFS
ncbi:Y-family DNA polymerase [Thalassotalea sediminis]|uniref:Y-family DNA polymerase n=1 Tax=Thalassotalea sediminis TaxID=1759089 RepID=UPI002572DC2F|nr:DNA polymerase Y family protein [Thalassotalea sediminis]